MLANMDNTYNAQSLCANHFVLPTTTQQNTDLHGHTQSLYDALPPMSRDFVTSAVSEQTNGQPYHLVGNGEVSVTPEGNHSQEVGCMSYKVIMN